MPIQVIVFDCDGVLLDSVDVKTRAFASLFAEHGPEAVEFIVAYHLANGGVSRYAKFAHFYRKRLGREITEAESKTLDKRFTAACLDALLKAPMIPGAREFLAANPGGRPLYVCSGAPELELAFIFDHMDLTGHFKAIYGSPTPKAENLARIVAECGAPADEVLMVGDSGTDLDAALRVGARFLGVGEFPAPHDWMPDLTGLAGYLERIG
ncbi:MAG: HAD family hydrolase [Thermodesulfobacteriota bacterium]